MHEDITDIVKTIEIIEKEGEKELLNYLLNLDIDTLNRLLMIFSGPGNPTLIQQYNASLSGSALVGALIFLMLILLILPLFWISRSYLSTHNKKKRIAHSFKINPNQKIFTSINFILATKYKAVIK